MQYSQVRVKFEGEDGSGPGVNRGFFASFAAALKNPAKVSSSILHIVCSHTDVHMYICTGKTHTIYIYCSIGMPQGWSIIV